MAYFQAVAQIGLGCDDGLELLRAALRDQTPAAADGVFLLEPLVSLLAQVAPPPANIETVRELIQDLDPMAEQPDSTGPPPVEERRIRWLAEALRAPSVHVRKDALTYLRWRTRETDSPIVRRLVPLLLEAAHDDPDATVRRAAVQVLGRPGLPVPDHTEELIKCLHDSSPAVRWAAQTSLEQLSQPHAEPVDDTEPAASWPDNNDEMDPMAWLESLATRRNPDTIENA
jgi:hypothetical protein